MWTSTDVDAARLRVQAVTIRANLNEMAADQVLGKVAKAQLHAATAAGSARLDAIESAHATTTGLPRFEPEG